MANVPLRECSLKVSEDSCDLPEGADGEKVRQFRRIFAQVLAVTIVNLILLDLGSVIAFPTITIPELLKPSGDVTFTEEQASWFGSVAFICQPLGSLFSGVLFDPVGRKKTMLYVNIPLLAGWLLIYFATSVAYLYVGAVIMGVAIGFLDAPHITYLGEITEPRWRGILTCYAELCVAFGFCFVYFWGTSENWRTVSLICSSIPTCSILLITLIPESPVWLLSKGRKREAEKSLQWLRGWAKAEDVQKEFVRLVRHNNATLAEQDTLPKDRNELQSLSVGKKLAKVLGVDCLCQRTILQPMFLVVVYFAFSHVTGVTSTRPFMVEIFKELGTPLDPKWVTAISSLVGILGCVTGMLLLRKTGKRLLSLLSMWGCAIINLSLFTYGFFFNHLNVPLLMVSLFILLTFVWSLGIGQIPWMLISEVFPFRGRGIASGISAALSYVAAFVFTKTYYVTYYSFTLPGLFGFYGICAFLGGCFLYYFLPETEGKTLEEIESIVGSHFDKIRSKRENLNIR